MGWLQLGQGATSRTCHGEPWPSMLRKEHAKCCPSGWLVYRAVGDNLDRLPEPSCFEDTETNSVVTLPRPVPTPSSDIELMRVEHEARMKELEEKIERLREGNQGRAVRKQTTFPSAPPITPPLVTPRQLPTPKPSLPWKWIAIGALIYSAVRR